MSTAPRRRLLPGLDQVALRAMLPVGLLVTLAASLLAGAHPPLWEQGGLLVVAGAAVLVPDSAAPALLLVGQGYLWFQAERTTSPLVLLAAAGMVLVHVTALVAAQGPATMPVDGAGVRRWAWRGALVWAAGVPVWGLVLAAGQVPHARLGFVAGLLVLIALAAAAARSTRTD